MVEDSEQLDRVFHALANRTRRQMVDSLVDADLTVGEVAAPLPISLAAASKHLRVLRRAGIVVQVSEGRRRVCRLDPRPLTSASAWAAHYERSWNERLDTLAAALDEDENDRKGKGK